MFARCWPNFDQNRPNLPELEHMLVNVGQDRPKLREFRPSWVEVGQSLTNIDFGPKWPTLVESGPNVGSRRTCSTRSWANNTIVRSWYWLAPQQFWTCGPISSGGLLSQVARYHDEWVVKRGREERPCLDPSSDGPLGDRSGEQELGDHVPKPHPTLGGVAEGRQDFETSPQ